MSITIMFKYAFTIISKRIVCVIVILKLFVKLEIKSN